MSTSTAAPSDPPIAQALGEVLARLARDQRTVDEVYGTLHPHTSAGRAMRAAPSGPPTRRSVVAGTGSALRAVTDWLVKPLTFLTFFIVVTGTPPKALNPFNHTLYYPRVAISCVPYEPGPPKPPEPPKPPVRPPVVGHLYATLVYDSSKATQTDAVLRASPTVGPSIRALDCAWNVIDSATQGDVLTSKGLMTVATSTGMPALIVQNKAGKVLLAAPLPHEENAVVAAVTKVRAGG